jgi:predicted oxidoreductase
VAWFGRGHDDPGGAGPEPQEQEEDDSPQALLLEQWKLVQFINRSAGKLPVEAVVAARTITDRIRGVIDTAADRDLDIYAVVSIRGIIGDYLPTTLRTYLNLDPRLTDQVGPSGRTPRAALREQLDALVGAADDLLRAAREHDVDALFTQGNFLRTKFSRSDLDL